MPIFHLIQGSLSLLEALCSKSPCSQVCQYATQRAGEGKSTEYLERGLLKPQGSQVLDTHLSQSTNLLHRHIQAIEVQRFPTHSRQICHAHGLLLREGQITVHPHLPLRLTTQLIQLGDLLIGCSRRTGFLEGTGQDS